MDQHDPDFIVGVDLAFVFGLMPVIAIVLRAISR